MAFIKEESEDLKIEETFRVKHEDPEQQTDLTELKEATGGPTVNEVNHQPNFITLLIPIQSSQVQDEILEDQMRDHTREKPHTCQQCGKGFRNKHHLHQHMKIHTGEKPFTCEHCGKSFNRKPNLKRHVRGHTGEIPKPRGKTFTIDGNFKMNVTIFTRQKTYTCPQCGKCFSQKGHFEAHIRVHTGEKPYPCQQCGRSFKNKYYIAVHMRSHTGEKPFACQQCGKSYNRKTNLNRHMRAHTE